MEPYVLLTDEKTFAFSAENPTGTRGGCVSIPEDCMKFVMQRVNEDTVVVIDTYESLSGGEAWPDSTWPSEK